MLIHKVQSTCKEIINQPDINSYLDLQKTELYRFAFKDAKDNFSIVIAGKGLKTQDARVRSGKGVAAGFVFEIIGLLKQYCDSTAKEAYG